MFKPNLVTRLITTAFILPLSFGSVPSAEAYEVDYSCGQVRGYTSCVSYQDPNSPDIVYVTGPNGKDTMSISCYRGGGYKWNSYGPNTENFMEYIAEGFCED